MSVLGGAGGSHKRLPPLLSRQSVGDLPLAGSVSGLVEQDVSRLRVLGNVRRQTVELLDRLRVDFLQEIKEKMVEHGALHMFKHLCVMYGAETRSQLASLKKANFPKFLEAKFTGFFPSQAQNTPISHNVMTLNHTDYLVITSPVNGWDILHSKKDFVHIKVDVRSRRNGFELGVPGRKWSKKEICELATRLWAVKANEYFRLERFFSETIS